jgi:hypothetical protein
VPRQRRQGAVRKINEQLIEPGYSTGLDEKDILPGHDWDMVIKKAIKAANASSWSSKMSSVAVK